MPTQYRFRKVISNGYATKVVLGMTRAEVEQKASAQLAAWQKQANIRSARWQAQLTKQAIQDQLHALEDQAASENSEAQTRIDVLSNLLRFGLNNGLHFRWEGLKQHKQYPSFAFNELQPSYDDIVRNIGVPAPSALEGLFSGKRKKREELEHQAQAMYQAQMAAFEARKAQAIRGYQSQREAWERGRNEYNASIDAKRQLFAQGEPATVSWVLSKVIETLSLPEEYGKDYDIAFNLNDGIAVINMQLPTLEEIPRVIGYKFVRARKAIDAIEMKPRDFDALYDSMIHQIALLTIHRVFREADSPALQSVVFNGWVTGVDRKTGNDFTSCIISVQAPRREFQSMILDRVDPKECVRSMKGLVAGPLAQLAPVKPIMDLNRVDTRFIESREVLANLSSSDNLAVMDWEDFEHLIRELFSKVFGGEDAEVRVTQASRDRGVDAIAFDPDPIRGGKFVIQAKRYNNVVPVSAVRDLYGTMINEGAVKGIIVTTSHFGNDSREFAKDKPITLIDGANLIHMFNQYGYDVHIELQ